MKATKKLNSFQDQFLYPVYTLFSNLDLSSSKRSIVNILHTKIRAAFGVFL